MVGGTDTVAPGPLWVQLPGVEAVPLSAFGAALQHNALCAKRLPFRAAALAWHDSASEPLQPVVQSAADATAFVLLDLGVTLFAQQCQRWRRCGKAWTTAPEIQSCIRYFLKGAHLGQRPIFDGICALGGHLLHGALGETGLSSKRSGPPANVQGEVLVNVDADTCQPPFLLRWSPDAVA